MPVQAGLSHHACLPLSGFPFPCNQSPIPSRLYAHCFGKSVIRMAAAQMANVMPTSDAGSLPIPIPNMPITVSRAIANHSVAATYLCGQDCQKCPRSRMM